MVSHPHFPPNYTQVPKMHILSIIPLIHSDSSRTPGESRARPTLVISALGEPSSSKTEVKHTAGNESGQTHDPNKICKAKHPRADLFT